MDGEGFDNVARKLQVNRPRRGVVGFLFGGALGLAGMAGSEAKGKGGKGKGKGKGKKKDKGTCTKTSAQCLGSACGMGDTCCAQIDCDCRQGLVCNRSNPKSEKGTCGCIAGEVMHNGRCGVKTGCISAGSVYDPATQVCCSGSSHKERFHDVCDPGHLACNTDGDCTGGSCRGWQCYAPELSCSIYF